MCGIFGFVSCSLMSSDTELYFLDLLEENKKRGGQSLGTAIVHRGKRLRPVIYRELGDPSVERGHFLKQDCEAILGHTRIATGKDSRGIECTHPIESDTFALAHNGILLNYRAVMKRFGIKIKVPVDTAVLVELIEKLTFGPLRSVPEAISLACEQLEGGYACWLLDKRNSDIYLWRNMSPLYYLSDDRGLSFSSIQFSRMLPMLEGFIYKVVDCKLDPVATFQPRRYY